MQATTAYSASDVDEVMTTPPAAVPSIITVPKHQNQTLSWHHEVDLIGDKVPNPRLHTCDSCQQPILVYGRLIPCKHVFCLDCAQEESKDTCQNCQERVIRVEKTGLGSIFRCRKESCKRTYLSQRDLLAHIKHRHSKKQKLRRPPD